MTRREIAHELRMTGLILSIQDYNEIARMLEEGFPAGEVLGAAAVERWPGVEEWLRGRLQAPQTLERNTIVLDQ